MSQYILLKNIRVQNANAVAGFTWGFPAITHFLGFTHHLTRKLMNNENYTELRFTGCAVISHNTQVHTYRPIVESPKGSGNFLITEPQFCQSRNPAYQHGEEPKYKVGTPPVIEEGKMNMTVSLLISYEGYIGQNKQDNFKEWLLKNSLLQRLAGGSILDIDAIEIHDLAIEKEANTKLRVLKRALLPGFVLKDHADYLEEYYQAKCKDNDEAELLDAWLDFIALKQKSRPKSNLILKYIEKQKDPELIEIWLEHLKQPYEKGNIPDVVKALFTEIKTSTELMKQWVDYCEPTDKTDADWEYLSKPKRGYLVPIMTGYKAISEVYKNHEVANTRDAKIGDTKGTDVCFVESVHSIGEWKSVHRIKNAEELAQCIWKYKPYEVGWYLCTQTDQQTETNNDDNCSRD